MMKNFDEHSLKEAMKLASTPAGKELAAMLQAGDSNALRKAADHAAAGNYEEMKKSMEAILSSPEARALLETLRGQANG